MKSNPSPSAPLNLCPPTGITGTTLTDSPVKDTPSYKGKALKEYKAGKVNGYSDAAESPKSILTLDNERKAAIGIKNESELVRAYWEGWLEGWNGGHAPASPVDSVGVPEPCSAKYGIQPAIPAPVSPSLPAQVSTITQDQMLKKYEKAARLRWSSPIPEWRDAFPTVESLVKFRHDVGQFPCGESCWDDAFSLAYNLSEGVSESTRSFLLEVADLEWGRQILAIYAEYGLTIDASTPVSTSPSLVANDGEHDHGLRTINGILAHYAENPTTPANVLYAVLSELASRGEITEKELRSYRADGHNLTTCASHAAKDAKIKALEKALRWCVAELVANHQAESVLHARQFPDAPPLKEPDSLEDARAALALPCAPLGS